MLLQIGVGRKDQAKIDRHFTLGADGTNAAVLQNAEQLALHRQRQFADFIEEQRAAMRIEEQALTPAVCAGEGSLDVAEQFGLDHLGRNRAQFTGTKGLSARSDSE